ncbi:trophoblast glycoprotein isoform X2 [Lingula anatina]|nr:trophoblast glycoprotein isoform X2 [Lingula anatina]XP_013412690.1 trophoblast glycoprotein isoform X2 [Lingula anatina]XP_013412695.1 trophoblast glycoprotein isoform X2 [Lingula anatina]XP_013412702.1 trophoblast glycoprotein isoform X2 [Lingula anatina]|eukprot:XP_013412681.1 trophoblast glycoprotein isoform X2 [Lingula anatina]
MVYFLSSRLKGVLVLLLLFQLPLALNSCPKFCECTNGPTVINCTDRGLSNVPLFPKESVRIYLDRNNITIIQDGKLNHLNQLEKLTFADNQVSHIDAGAFHGLTNLEELDLTYNQLSFKLPGSMDNTLVYSKKSMPHPCNILHGMTKLKTLKLQHNKLGNLFKEGAYACIFQDQVYSLKTLELSHNNISGLTNNLFLNMSLEYLNLSYNRLMSVPKLFQNLTSLTTLDLSHNEITCVNNLNTSIVSIDLSNNPFSCSSAKCIQNLKGQSEKYNHFRETGKYVCHTPEKCNGQDIYDLDLTNLCQSGLSTTKKILAGVMGFTAGMLTLVSLWMCYTRNLFKVCVDRWRSFHYKEVPRDIAMHHI